MTPQTTDQKKLGQILIDRGLISLQQLEEALAEQGASGRFFGEILVQRGVTTEEKIARALSEQLGYAYVDLKQMPPDKQAMDLVPQELCQKFTMVPVFVSQSNITMAMTNPLDVIAVDLVQAKTGLRVRPVFACPSDIKNYLLPRENVAADLKRAPSTPAPTKTVSAEKMMPHSPFLEQVSSLHQQANLRPVIERVNTLVEKALDMGASDIHLEPEKKQFSMRYRIDGILHKMPPLQIEDQAAVLSRIKIMADMDIAEKRLPQDGRIRMHLLGRDIDLRVSTFPSMYGENMVIRLLDRSSGLLKLDQLGFEEDTLATFRKLVARPYGMILVTGPTGSGKTTALYAALSELDAEQKNVITLEDPVEYEISGIRQSQVNVKAGLTFSSGLRSIVRQDPDIIMIGEIRDRETAEIAIHAALTGHLVLSTLHTNDAPSAAARLIDMGVEPFLVSSSVIGILAQRLLRTLCPECKKPYTPPSELLVQCNLSVRDFKKDLTFYQEVGCVKCKNFGYAGRAGIYELLVPNDAIRELITKKSPATLIRDKAVDHGMVTLRQAGIRKVIKGETSMSEVLRVTEEIGGNS